MRAPWDEVEAKFVVPSLDPIRGRLRNLSASLIQPRHREVNLRFDLADGSLRRSGRVLRLRTGDEQTLTLKSPGPDPEHRREIELEIQSPDRARDLLEELGYQVVFTYEKDREVQAVGAARVMLDELPFGSFVEIEGDDLSAVRATADRLELAWRDRLAMTYLGLFETLAPRRGWSATEATFEALAGAERPSVDEVLTVARVA